MCLRIQALRSWMASSNSSFAFFSASSSSCFVFISRSYAGRGGNMVSSSHLVERYSCETPPERRWMARCRMRASNSLDEPHRLKDLETLIDVVGIDGLPLGELQGRELHPRELEEGPDEIDLDGCVAIVEGRLDDGHLVLTESATTHPERACAFAWSSAYG